MSLRTVNSLLSSASSTRPENFFPQILPWLLALLGAVIIGAAAIYFVRRSLYSDSSPGRGGFTLQDLRDLHRAGELSDEEFERAKSLLISRLKAAKSETADAQGAGNSSHEA